MKQILDILDDIGLPFAYDHFAEGETPRLPFVCYTIPSTDNFSADGKVYKRIDEINLELYTDRKNIDIEEKIEDVLGKHEIFYEKYEAWMETEKLYQVLYLFDLIKQEEKRTDEQD